MITIYSLGFVFAMLPIIVMPAIIIGAILSKLDRAVNFYESWFIGAIVAWVILVIVMVFAILVHYCLFQVILV